MNKITAIVFSLFFLLSSRAWGIEYITEDGDWWNGLSSIQQLGVVQGLVAGFEVGFLDGYYVDQYMTGKKESFPKDFPPPSFSQPFVIYIHGISDFYLTHPSLKNITIGNVFSCFMDKMDSVDCLSKLK